MQILLDKLNKETGVLSCALAAKSAVEPPTASPQMQFTVLAKKGIRLKINAENKKEIQYKHILNKTDKLVQVCTLLPQITRVIR